MNLFGLELFSSPRTVCFCHCTSPPSCSNSTDEREETLRLRSRGPALRRVCGARAVRAGAARRRAGGSGVDGQRRCRVRGQCCTREPRLRGARGGRAGTEEPQQPAAGEGEGEVGRTGGPLYVWNFFSFFFFFLAKGCREACWSFARF